MAADALGAAGRQVQCAACAGFWTAMPTLPAPGTSSADPEPDDDEIAFRADRDTLFAPADEDMQDTAFLRAAADIPPAAADGGMALRRREALARRKKDINRSLPLARFRRAARVALALLVVLFVGAAVGLRTEIVRAVPALDGLYRAVGLGTNVLGLDFLDVKTLRTTREGTETLMVSARIVNITDRVAFVPPVLVSLLDSEDAVIYEWGVTPATRNMLPGDVLGIDTQLTSPPQGIARVRLTFVEGQNRPGGGAR